MALPIAAGVLAHSLGLVLRPEIAALSMSGSCILVAVDALTPKRLHLPTPAPAGLSAAAPSTGQEPARRRDRPRPGYLSGPTTPASGPTTEDGVITCGGAASPSSHRSQQLVGHLARAGGSSAR